MPISSPPQNYDLDPSGTSGVYHLSHMLALAINLTYLLHYISIYLSSHHIITILIKASIIHMFPLGIPVGPDVMIVDEDLHPICLSSTLSTTTTGVGVTGNIFLRGPPCFGEKMIDDD